MKKGWMILGVLVSLAIVSLVLVSNLVSAAQFLGTDLSGGAQKLIDMLSDIFTPLFQFLLGTSVQEYFFEKVLFLIMLYIIILSILKRIDIFKANYFIQVIISASVSIISSRYLTEINFIQLILHPYGVFGAAALIFIPFVFYFYLVENTIQGTGGRKLAWILFAAVFIGMWITNRDKVKEFEFVYWIGIGLVALAILFDKKIKAYFGIMKQEKWMSEQNEERIADLQAKIKKYGGVGSDEARHIVAKAWKEIKARGGHAPEGLEG